MSLYEINKQLDALLQFLEYRQEQSPARSDITDGWIAAIKEYRERYEEMDELLRSMGST